MPFIEKFRRITTTGEYFAEIDGLRFIAIFSVVLYHISSNVKMKAISTLTNNSVFGLLYDNGWHGVHLFFVISGFIIALPFARHFIQGSKRVELKNYFLRRLTRLEPPYFISIILFFAIQLLANQTTFSFGLPGVAASMVYLNNIIFNDFSHFVNAALWSLEIEIQFYILAILFVQVFRLKKIKRRLVLIGIILGVPLLQDLWDPGITTVYYFLQFFFLGFLLVDFYLDESRIKLPKAWTVILGLISLIPVLYNDHRDNTPNQYVFLIAIFIFYYLVLMNGFANKFFTNRYIAIIGGMCYSIYLMHAPIIAALGNLGHYFEITNNLILNLFFYTLFCLPLVFLPSALYFRYIEKPCMDKNWPKKLAQRFNVISKIKALDNNIN